MFAFWWLFQFDFWLMPAVLYVWISIAYIMTVSQFWLFSIHVLDPRQARRLFGFVGAGGLLGGVAGGQVARLVSNAMGTRTTFLVAAAILLTATALITLVHRLQAASEEPSAGTGRAEKADKAKGGFEVIGGSRHLQAISTVLVLTVVVAQIVDIQFNWSVEQAITGLDARTAFYGNFYSVMGISAFVFQLAFTSRIHRALGVGVALKVLPVTMAIGTVALFVAALMFPAILLTAAFMLKVGENGLRYPAPRPRPDTPIEPPPRGSSYPTGRRRENRTGHLLSGAVRSCTPYIDWRCILTRREEGATMLRISSFRHRHACEGGVMRRRLTSSAVVAGVLLAMTAASFGQRVFELCLADPRTAGNLSQNGRDRVDANVERGHDGTEERHTL